MDELTWSSGYILVSINRWNKLNKAYKEQHTAVDADSAVKAGVREAQHILLIHDYDLGDTVVLDILYWNHSGVVDNCER